MGIWCGYLGYIEWLSIVADQQSYVSIAVCLLDKDVWAKKKERFMAPKIGIKFLLRVNAIWIVLCEEADCVVTPVSINRIKLIEINYRVIILPIGVTPAITTLTNLVYSRAKYYTYVLKHAINWSILPLIV